MNRVTLFECMPIESFGPRRNARNYRMLREELLKLNSIRAYACCNRHINPYAQSDLDFGFLLPSLEGSDF